MSDDKSIEDEFRKTYEAHGDEIAEAISEANKAIARAEKLSEKYGIPFRGPPSNFDDSYFPTTMPKGLDSDVIDELTGAYGHEGYPGWQTSHC